MEDLYFGNKDTFFIEVKDFDRQAKMGRVGFIINQKRYGDLKTRDDMWDVAAGLENLIQQREALYEADFVTMTDAEIFTHCLFLDRDTTKFTDKDYELVKQIIATYGIWFGEQFDNVTHITYFKDQHYHFLWTYNVEGFRNKSRYLKTLQSEKVSKEDFEDAANAFLTAMR